MTVSFGQLQSWTDILAVKLQTLGVKAETSVGIYLEKSVDFVSAYIAILKAGRKYFQQYGTLYYSRVLIISTLVLIFKNHIAATLKKSL